MVLNLWPSREGSEAAARDPRRSAVVGQARIGSDDVRREHHEVADYIVFD